MPPKSPATTRLPPIRSARGWFQLLKGLMALVNICWPFCDDNVVTENRFMLSAAIQGSAERGVNGVVGIVAGRPSGSRAYL
jgi:hypothetical protein